MSKKLQKASAFCADCSKVVANGEAIIKMEDVASGVPLLSGSLLSATALHHRKNRKYGEGSEQYPMHNDMTLKEGESTIGTFITTSNVAMVRIDIVDPQIRQELESELRETRRARELERRNRIE